MIFYIIIIIGIILDLFSKYLANIYLQNKINIIGDLLYFKYAENTGIAFSVQIPELILKIGTIFLIIGIFCYYRNEIKEKEGKNKKITLTQISFGLIIAGAIGNAIERIFNGYVIDFIGIKYFSIFNLADSFITIGAIFLIYISIKSFKT